MTPGNYGKEKKDLRLKQRKSQRQLSRGPSLTLVIDEMNDEEKEKKKEEEKDEKDKELQRELEMIKNIEENDENKGVNRSCYTLQGVSFEAKKGQLVAVVGAVGSGKSSLLSGLLGTIILLNFIMSSHFHDDIS